MPHLTLSTALAILCVSCVQAVAFVRALDGRPGATLTVILSATGLLGLVPGAWYCRWLCAQTQSCATGFWPPLLSFALVVSGAQVLAAMGYSPAGSFIFIAMLVWYALASFAISRLMRVSLDTAAFVHVALAMPLAAAAGIAALFTRP